MKSYGGLRPQELDDVPYIHMWRTDLEVMEGTVEDIWPLTLEAVRDIVVNRMKAPGRTMTIQQKDGSPVGEVQVVNWDARSRNAEVRIVIGEQGLWRKGYGKAGMEEFIPLVFGAMPVRRLFARAPSFNAGALALLNSLGFVREGVERGSLYRNGAYNDVVVLSLLREEWEARDARR